MLCRCPCNRVYAFVCVGVRACGCACVWVRVSVCDCRDARVNGSGGSFECEENKSGHWPIGSVFLE